ncbi:hypothetical protein [Endozoicomonas sp. 8E]|uniref:hypothetical protein n=1 Tax=Endozoicomonas sp. 8E TaxID=3035692 RepID=UPI00293907FB|nr:hypothetical protein [Endozoicomonas sp. 8E]WOG26984.1 hypothetical protein P6910_20900 [Endozoicomonas sp. 8E]
MPHNCLCHRCIRHSDPANKTSNDPFAIQLQCTSGQLAHGIDDNPVNTTAPAEQIACNLKMVDKDGRLRPCGEVWKNVSALANHRIKAHTGQQTFNVIMITEDGQERPCGKVCMNARALSNHKKSTHTGQRTCDVTLVGQDGQQRPCGTVCKSTKALSAHKLGCHSGQKTCEVIVVGKEGKAQPCGRTCKNAGALSNHKRIHRKRKPFDANQKDGSSPP